MSGLHVLVTLGLTLPELDPADRSRIAEAAGPDSKITVVQDWHDAVDVAADVDVIFGMLPPKLFAATTELRWVHAIASGVDMFMYREFRDSDVVLTGEKGLVGGHLADHAFGLLLALTRRIGQAIRLGTEAWAAREEMRVVELELEGLVMGIVGFGGTGRAIARRAAAFGMPCLAVDEHEVPGSAEVDAVWPTSRLPELLGQSDVVAVCCPLTKATTNLFDRRSFGQMRPTAFLVNVTRGEIVDNDALVTALHEGSLAGAALDVVADEPLAADHPLWSFGNVVMTPHTAGASQHRARRNIDRFCDNLERLRNGDQLIGVVDKQAGY